MMCDAQVVCDTGGSREKPEFYYSKWDIPPDEYIGSDGDPAKLVVDRKINDWTSPVLVKVHESDRPFTDDELEKLQDIEPNDEQMLKWLTMHPLIGYVLVANLDQPFWKSKWKFPAGHRKKEDDPNVGWLFDRDPGQTALHETESETGIGKMSPAAFRFVGGYFHPIDRNHWRFFHTALLASCQLSEMNRYHPENEGVTPRFFTVHQFYVLVAKKHIVDAHVDALERFPLLP